ncbi:MAG: CerR family C-terminal domain-containing protein [Kiritimatiellae bacterium]|nr:CerR family C-terminal domain-containing protein [Kiritimatiellia bacterium]
MNTKQRLLKAACELISMRGYEQTTVNDICTAAGANIAAVNYYFGSKEDLYKAAWAHAASLIKEHHPLPDKNIDPLEWLNEFVRVRIEAVFDDTPGGWFPRLVVREMTNPTEMANAFYETYLTPKMNLARTQVAKLLGVPPSSFLADTCTVNINGMLVHLNCMRTFKKGPMGTRVFSEKMINDLITQMQTFAEGGIAALKKAKKGACA